MADGDRTGRFDDLFAPHVRATLGESTYGSWRSISAPDAVSLSFGFPFPDAFPTDRLAAAADEVLADGNEAALQYGGGAAADRLSEVVAARERDRGVEAEPDEVVLTSGANHAIDLVCRTFLGPDDAVFLAAPTFMGALSLVRNHDPEIVGFPVDGDGIDVGALADELAARAEAGRRLPTLVYVVPNFQNPTGVTLTRERRERLVALAAEYDFLIVEDDAYGALRYDGEDVAPLAALDDEGRVIRLGTFSKTIAPGVRTGWAVAHGEIAAQLERFAAGGPNAVTRAVLARYCEAGGLEETLPALRTAYERRRDHMLTLLAQHAPDGVEWTDPDGGFFVWVTLPEGLDAEELLPVAAEAGVTYLPGEMFYPDGGGRRELRLSFSHVPPDAMADGVAALCRAIRDATGE